MCQTTYLKIVIVVLLFCGFSLPLLSAEDNGPFTVGTITAEAGEIKSGSSSCPNKIRSRMRNSRHHYQWSEKRESSSPSGRSSWL